MAYEITVITPDGTPAPPRRVDAATVQTAIAQAAVDGTQLRIRPITATHHAADTSEPTARPEGPS